MAELHVPAAGVWTFEEFEKLPEVEGARYEVIAGSLYVTGTPPLLHQEVLGSFLVEMLGWARRKHGLGRLIPGPVGVILGPGDFPSPDLVFVREDRREIITGRAIEGVPDLIVECVAPETAERDRGLKHQRYELYGVPEYWAIDAESRIVEIYRHDGRVFSPAEVIRSRWFWQPMPNGPVLELNLPELLEEYDELMLHIERNEQRRAAEKAGKR
ncbi:MAG TPA: Uma2 family endonuclease [Longimicrobium sp.]|nr:Uma2 family endonuclease [Longimicrobium sp.]